ncbi:MAG: UDP-glucose/GDP-mannose dehydrogenase family protein [Bryobacterales bacterium]|nr:UDP-glucose/GDP-mannose dehydrogenase family protein [Bryobacterales bacterium]MEB2361930.1 UDP-glucose/GDP-mannose dehydrogenase family protein [Bryobacterales bacterium]
MKRLVVVGTGYVGLVSGAMFASLGNRVTCVDKDPSIVEALRAGRSTIHEPGLDEILQSTIADGTLSFTTETAEAVAEADATFIAVGTPSLETGAYDFQYVEAAAHEIGRALRRPKRHIVVLKSTVTPDIYTRVQTILAGETEGSGAQVEVVSNPEFLAEGTAIRDFSQPHRIIVGAVSAAARQFMEGLYRPFTKREPGVLQLTDPKSAIVTKLAANSFLACRVGLINELARYCDAVSADIEHVRAGLASDPRIGHLFLYPGPGYGGSCFGKDLRALRESAREHGADLSLVPAIEESNLRHKLYMPRRIERQLEPLAGRTLAVWGIAFKARTDDIRESPAVDAIEYLLERGARIRAHDPEAGRRAAQHFGSRITLCGNKYDAVDGAAALVIMTEWDTYKSPDYHELHERLSGRIIFDARNILDVLEVRQAGLTYVGMGRGCAT